MANERAELVSDLQSAFDTDLADAVIDSIKVINYDPSSFNAVTGKAAKTILEQDTTRGILISHWQYEVFNSNIEPNDEGMLILQDELSIVPSIGTELQFVSPASQVDIVSRVVEVKQDPMHVTWELRIRR